ncbi:ABC transporter ATP-binding protein [Bacillus marinisedimentorum]|uniref:ABC transporter ATP-binding protein n=1 Tax=Bacillus marinisedimentorum TaxID=1821260 RepID=UPI000D093D92|nr:ATP-binding cassette domain-containing protein [Bacillus marinisedimentorum]
MMQPVIEMKNVRLAKNGRTILEVPELTVKEGEVTGIIGPNGAGKSTLMKVMAMLEDPDAGSISLSGREVFPGNITIETRRQTAVVFQHPLMMDTTVFKNVAAPLSFRKVRKQDVKGKVVYWLERFGVGHLAGRHARTLSGGESQRVSLARAFVTDPRVLFLDEPFSALDLPTRKKLLQDFKQILKETGTTTLFISHDHQEISYLCGHVAMVYGGKMIKKTELPLDGVKNVPEGFHEFLEGWMAPLAP